MNFNRLSSLYCRSKTVFIGIGSIALLLITTITHAEPASRVGRIAYLHGPVSFLPAGGKNWAAALLNRPLSTRDRLWVNGHAKVELQLGGAVARLNQKTDMTILNLDDQTAQFQLSQGTFFLHIRRMTPNQTYEIDTPNLAFVAKNAGDYRLDVNNQNGTTTVSILKGQGTAYGEKGETTVLHKDQSYLFNGTDLHSQLLEFYYDNFDKWCLQRDRRADRSASLAYVSANLIGYEDLDEYGTWQEDGNYGYVWVPHVHPGWAPYRYGHWAWIEPWGWTWIDEEPWGFAPFHYGRWVYDDGYWCWVPGPVNAWPVYAPALVGFIGGVDFMIGNDIGIGWFPLGPGDVYVPPYEVSQTYFININITNITIERDKVSQFYTRPLEALAAYRYKQVQTAMTVVPKTAFTQSQLVAKMFTTLPKSIFTAPLTVAPKILPTPESLLGGALTTKIMPKVTPYGSIIVKNTPPTPLSFAHREAEIFKNAGVGSGAPLNTERLKLLHPTAAPAFIQVEKPDVQKTGQTEPIAQTSFPSQLHPAQLPPTLGKVQPSGPQSTPIIIHHHPFSPPFAGPVPPKPPIVSSPLPIAKHTYTMGPAPSVQQTPARLAPTTLAPVERYQPTSLPTPLVHARGPQPSLPVVASPHIMGPAQEQPPASLPEQKQFEGQQTVPSMSILSREHVQQQPGPGPSVFPREDKKAIQEQPQQQPALHIQHIPGLNKFAPQSQLPIQ